MHLTIINDSHCANAMARQAARAALLTDASVYTLGVPSYSSIAAAGNLIDVLDAQRGMRSAVLVNVAPRYGEAKKWENGTPFCYFTWQSVVVIATTGGYTLSLVKKLGLVDAVNVLDVRSSLMKMAREHLLSPEEEARIAQSQFRSFEFLPRVASYLLHENEPPSTVLRLDEFPDAPAAVWWVDNFGNVKTTLLPEDVGFETGKRVSLSLGEFMCHASLKDVPDGEPALIVGSSGVEARRFLELVVQGGRAAERLSLSVGDELLDDAEAPPREEGAERAPLPAT